MTSVSCIYESYFIIFQIDLHTIDKVYKAKYGIYLSDDVKRIYYGEYADALLKLLKKEEIPDIYQHSIPLP
uniref:NAD(P)/FAD-dependent oxidoreductase n=1 Tax=Schistosoma mansoni TaxID=6183 RepID=A0A5K4F8F5_SCHMA